MSSPARALSTATLAVLGITWAFAVVSGSVGLNALIKSNQQKSYVKKAAARATPGVKVDINTDDQFHVGVVLTVACALLGVLLFHFIVQNFIRSKFFVKVGARTQAFLTGFTTVWILAALIPFDIFARTRSAKTTATLGTISLPQSIIDAQSRALGVSPVYWDQRYIRMLAIIPWFAFAFGAVSTVLLFKASSQRPVSSSQEKVVSDDVEDKQMEERLP